MNNPVTIAIFSAAVSLLVIVFSIFAASWLNQRHTERLLDQMDKRFDQRIDLLAQNNAQHFTAIETRLDRVERQMEARLDRVERQLDAVFKPSVSSR